MAEVARLDSVDLRDVWPNEASDFTPWLADNLGALGEELGMKLELVRTEAPVGTFSVDILAKDIGENRVVVIENQLEPTNHDHLGKVLTYAAGYNADVMVWIVKDFRDEHRQALDWLNQRTGEETEFYGVEVRAVRIDNSRPAYVFDVVARPNKFRKSHVTNAGGDQYLGVYEQFWQRVVESIRDKTGLARNTRISLNPWQYMPSDVPGVSIVPIFRRSDVFIEFVFDARFGKNSKEQNRARNDRLYDCLNGQQERIESAFERLNWIKPTQTLIPYISIQRAGSITDSEETISEIAEWIVSSVAKFHTNVVPIVRDAAEAVDSEMDEERAAALRNDEANEDEE